MPHVAVNTRLLLPGRLEGISRFAYELLSRMANAHPEVQFTYFFDRPFDSAYLSSPNIRAEVLFPPARHPLLWYIWFHLRVRHRLSRLRPDVFYSPEFYLSLHRKVPEIATFHDLAYEHFPRDLAPLASRYVRHFSPIYARHASKIVTVSEYTRQDLILRYGLDASHIEVVYNSAGNQFGPITEAEKALVRAKYSEGKHYFHFVGTIQPRKNLENLLLGFEAFKNESESDMKLLLVGRPGWNYEGALRTYEAMRHRSDVLFTGFVPDEALNGLYAASSGLVFVPWLEGFGIPIVEAFHAEVPVIASDRTSMPEIAGNAAMLVDPGSPDTIAQAMLAISSDERLSQQLVVAGRDQREQFSWDRSAQALWDVLAPYVR